MTQGGKVDPQVTYYVGRGEPLPLGLSRTCDGYNFAVFSRHATQISFLLLDEQDRLVDTIVLDPQTHRSGDLWHFRLVGKVPAGGYALKVEGPWSPDEGHRFNGETLLLDPYAAAVSLPRPTIDTDLPVRPLKARWVAHADEHAAEFDWQDDRPPRHPWRNTIIYETHVRGLTAHPSSGVSHHGRYFGLVEKIPYLLDLGITAVELMPIQEFRDNEISGRTGQLMRNYWGYNPVALFAPKSGYASGDSPTAAITELKTLVRELHKADIEVILDVVFNHTAEGNESGPTFSFRGLDNSVYYLLSPDKRRYEDFAGCGNTLNCNHPVVRALIIDCLRPWVSQFRIDGFRFDLASILGRDTEGRLLPNPPLLEQIAEDPLLRHTKLIAEAWDLGGAFQVGHFPGQRWAEWNCCFRDVVRRFWRGDAQMTGSFATRLCGSADLYGRGQESPINSINFVTCHDGFTLNDVVSFARKHNEGNGDDNREGAHENHSENNGTEGSTDDPQIEAMRLRQIKNFLVTLFVSRGVPMLLGGDEFRRTQQGNNNAYCQDNLLSWYDWNLAASNADLIRFVKGLIALRKMHPVLSAEKFYSDADINWFGVDGNPPEWHGPNNQIGCEIHEPPRGALCLLFNAALEPCQFELPSPIAHRWHLLVDTAQRSPDDLPWTPLLIVANRLTLISRSAMILSATTPAQALSSASS